MTKRLSRAVKKRKRTNWKAAALRLRVEVATLTQDWNKWHAEWEHEFNNKLMDCQGLIRILGSTVDETQGNIARILYQQLEAELTRYRLICDWACQRIEKLEADAGKQQSEKRILLDTLFEVQAENIMQGEDILRQRDELIKLRGVTGERVSCQR